MLVGCATLFRNTRSLLIRGRASGPCMWPSFPPIACLPRRLIYLRSILLGCASPSLLYPSYPPTLGFRREGGRPLPATLNLARMQVCACLPYPSVFSAGRSDTGYAGRRADASEVHFADTRSEPVNLKCISRILAQNLLI